MTIGKKRKYSAGQASYRSEIAKKFDTVKHPRDSRGRFIHTPDKSKPSAPKSPQAPEGIPAHLKPNLEIPPQFKVPSYAKAAPAHDSHPTHPETAGSPEKLQRLRELIKSKGKSQESQDSQMQPTQQAIPGSPKSQEKPQQAQVYELPKASEIAKLPTLGEGAFGVVRVDKEHGVAIKELHEGRFSKTEVEISRKAGELGVGPRVLASRGKFMAMEYLEGYESLENKGAPWDTLETTMRVLSQLSKLHLEGVSHQDLHKGNVMLSKGDEIRLIDFGEAEKSWELVASELFTDETDLDGQFIWPAKRDNPDSKLAQVHDEFTEEYQDTVFSQYPPGIIEKKLKSLVQRFYQEVGVPHE